MEIGDCLGSEIEDCGIELESGDQDWRLGIRIGDWDLNLDWVDLGFEDLDRELGSEIWIRDW